MLRRALELAGYDVIEARDTSEGLMSYRDTPVDLIISDVLIVGQEGIESIGMLCREVPDVKIIAISGGGYIGQIDILDIAKRLGAKRTLQKPFALQELFMTVEEVLQGA